MYTYIHIFMYIYISIHICMYIYKYIYIYMYTLCNHMCKYLCIYMYIYIYVYIYIWLIWATSEWRGQRDWKRERKVGEELTAERRVYLNMFRVCILISKKIRFWGLFLCLTFRERMRGWCWERRCVCKVHVCAVVPFTLFWTSMVSHQYCAQIGPTRAILL